MHAARCCWRWRLALPAAVPTPTTIIAHQLRIITTYELLLLPNNWAGCCGLAGCCFAHQHLITINSCY